MRRAAPLAPSGGFALVEALASLVIVAMISLLLLQGLATGRRVWEHIDDAASRGEGVDGAQTALRDRIEQIYPQMLFDRNPPYVDVTGGDQTISFLSSPPQVDRPAPLRRYRLSLTAAGDLDLSSVSDVAATRPPVPVLHEILLRGVRRIDLAYFGATASDPNHRWRDRWAEQPVPPELVRVRLIFQPGDRRVWPDLIVRPRATIDTACVLYVLGHSCKGRA